MKQYATLEDTVYFWFAANYLNSGNDGASPAADVRLVGAAADAIPVLSPTPILLTHASYPAGCYELAVAATAANGFAANNTYAVFCTLAIDSQNPTGFVGCFDLKPILIPESIADLLSEIVAANPVREDFLLLRYDHVPARNAQNVQIGKAMQFRLYNPDPAFGIDLTTFKLRFDEGSWYRYGDSRLTFTEISYREYKVYFNPPNFDYNSEIMIEVYCEDHLNNPGIKLEIL